MFEIEKKQTVEMLEKNRIKGFPREWEEGQQVTIVNAGLVKAGKSELFNALVDKPKQFKTGAARKTTQNNMYQWEKGICLVDTPGIDAKQDDTEEAFRAFRQADLVLFLHNVDTGEYKETECQFIHKLKECFPSEADCLHRIWFIASWADRKEMTGELDLVLNRMREQLTELGFVQVPELIVLSATRYLQGKEQNKQLLIKKSRIGELRIRLLSVADQLSVEREKLLNEQFQVCRK